MNRPVRVCTLGEIPKNRGKRALLPDGTEVALFRIDDEVYAVDNVCPHQHAPMIFDGAIDGCAVTCPLHGWTFDLRSGENVDGGAGLRSFGVEVRDGDVYVEPKPRPRWMQW